MAKVKLVRMPERSGLMRARMEGVRVATAEVGFSFSQTSYIHIGLWRVHSDMEQVV